MKPSGEEETCEQACGHPRVGTQAAWDSDKMVEGPINQIVDFDGYATAAVRQPNLQRKLHQPEQHK